MATKPASRVLPVRLTRHFEERFRERFPGVVASESALQREVAEAHFCPDDSDGRTYVTVLYLWGEKVAFVVAVEHGLLVFVTLFSPTLGWERRFAGRRTLPASVLLGAVA
jgi:hypothetical protein